MDDDEFEAACKDCAAAADRIARGTPEQIRKFAEDGWWDAMNTLRLVYNDWLSKEDDAS